MSPLEELLVRLTDYFMEGERDTQTEGVLLDDVSKALDVLRIRAAHGLPYPEPEPEPDAQTVLASYVLFALSELSWAVGYLEGEKTATAAFEKLVKARDALLAAFSD